MILEVAILDVIPGFENDFMAAFAKAQHIIVIPSLIWMSFRRGVLLTYFVDRYLRQSQPLIRARQMPRPNGNETHKAKSPHRQRTCRNYMSSRP